MAYKNKEKERLAQRKWYKLNKKQKLEKNQQRRLDIREWFKKYKSTLKCSSCPENHPSTLDFHHIKDKKHNVSDMVRRCFSKESILDEISKCIVLCANCHRKLHY